MTCMDILSGLLKIWKYRLYFIFQMKKELSNHSPQALVSLYFGGWYYFYWKTYGPSGGGVPRAVWLGHKSQNSNNQIFFPLLNMLNWEDDSDLMKLVEEPAASTGLQECCSSSFCDRGTTHLQSLALPAKAVTTTSTWPPLSYLQPS